MTKMLQAAALALVLGMGSNASAQPGQPDAAAAGVPAAAVTKDPAALRSLIGKSIETPEGDAIGTVRDVVVQGTDKAEVVVGVGGFLGLGEKMVTIPYDEITMSSEALVVSMTEEQLKRAPAYDPERAPGNSIKGGPKR